MADLSQMSDADLQAAYQAAAQPSPTQAMSDANLVSAYKEAHKDDPNAPAPIIRDGSVGPRFIDAASAAIGRLPSQLGHAAVDAVTGLPLMVEDAGVAARNLIAGRDAKGAYPYTLPSADVHAAEDQVFGAPQTGGERIGNALSSMLMSGGAASSSQLPANLKTVAAAIPESSTQVPANFMTPAQSQAQQLAQSLNKFQAAGYKIPPSTSNPTMTNKVLETVAGKVNTQNAASLSNSDAVTRNVAQELGLNPDAPLTLGAIQAVKKDTGGAWDQMRKINAIPKDNQFVSQLQAMRQDLTSTGEIGAKDSPLVAEIDGLLGTSAPRSAGTRSTPTPRPSAVPQPQAVTAPGAQIPADAPDAMGSLGNGGGSGAVAIPGGRSGGAPVLDPLTLTARQPEGPAGATAQMGGRSTMDPLTLMPTNGLFSGKQAVSRITDLRNSADVAFRQGDGSLGRGYKQLSQALEDQVQRAAESRAAAGDPTITPNVVQNFQNARQLYAKASTAENAFDEGTGKISLQKLGQMYANGEPLSGNMQAAGQFANSFRTAAKDPTKIGSAVNHLDMYAPMLSIMEGNTLGEKALGFAVPAARMGTKAYLMSALGQKGAVPSTVTDAIASPSTASQARAAALVQALTASKKKDGAEPRLSLQPAY